MLDHLVRKTEPIALEPVVPSIRSSDAKYSDDFMYLLRRRYGIVKQTDYSEALALGTHFHALLEFEGAPDLDTLWTAYRARTIAEANPRQLDRVAQDLDYAYGLWTDIIRNAPLSENGTSIAQYLARPHIRSVASELLVRQGLPFSQSRTIQIDRLLFNEQTNQLIIADLKSTGTDAQVRAAQCPFEFQTWHYLETLNAVLPRIIERFDLPADTTVGSMMHIIFRKPTIKMSGDDRDYTLTHKTITRGPRKGAVDTIRDYHGAPRWHNFVGRCKDWYRDNPNQVLRSVVHYSGNEALRHDYDLRLDSLMNRNRRLPVWCYHPRTESGAVEWHSTSPYYPFYLSPDHTVWPTIMAQYGFTIEHRDPPITLSAGEVRIEEPNDRT